MTTRRTFLSLTAASLATPALSKLAFAQAWPSTKPIRVIVPFSAGSSLDVIARIVSAQVSTEIGQTMVIENRGGAAGSIGAAIVAKAEPDGYTILAHASAHTLAPAIYAKLPYDASADFAGIISFGTLPNVLVVNPSKGYKTIQEFVAAAKASGEFTYASAGIGSTTHWAAERLRASAGFKGVHVPYKGGLDALTEVFAGRVDFACMGLSSALSFIQNKQLVALAVSTPNRSKALPDVPTTLEAGYKDSDYNYWNGYLAPAQTPRPVVEKLYEVTKKVLAQPDVMEKFVPQGIEPMPVTPASFDAIIKKEIADNKALVKAIGLTPT
ncbi:MAG TPA: tripartite tricarboxylate transporter substrate-binding protein [Pseudolabrys sp.]|jgi:tripartite-type tricarboxylate transporter receptor subunit TctC